MATDCDGYKQTMCGLDVHVIDITDSTNQAGSSASSSTEPGCSLIFLPGRGSLGTKYADRYNTGQFVLPSPLPVGGVRVIFPSSPVTDEQYEGIPTWFRLADSPAKDIDSAERYVLSDVEYSAGLIANLVMQEVRRCGWSRTFLGGHSQGAMLALHIQLTRLEQPLAGLCLFSGYVVYPLRQLVPLSERTAAAHLALNLDMMRSRGRVFVWHGELDENFPVNQALTLTRAVFRGVGCEGAIKLQVEAPGIAHSPVPPAAYQQVFSAMFASPPPAPSSSPTV